MTSPLARPEIRAGLNYLRPTAERPYSYVCEPPPGTPWENCAYDAHHMLIADARQASDRPCLEREGFALWEAPTTVTDFLDEAAVRSTYYREAAELALAATGARQAHVFDHLVRRREAGRGALNFGRSSSAGMAPANGRIHNDYTEASGRRRLALVIGDAQAAACVRRYGIVNIWRSIKGPVLDTPLAVCDARTVSAADLVESEVRYPRRTGEIYVSKHSPRHRWSYFPEMDRHEVLVFKQYDSQLSGAARFTLHTAFDLPEIAPGAPLRESIELRCLVVYESEEP
jgi:hypothetical protein